MGIYKDKKFSLSTLLKIGTSQITNDVLEWIDGMEDYTEASAEYANKVFNVNTLENILQERDDDTTRHRLEQLIAFMKSHEAEKVLIVIDD